VIQQAKAEDQKLAEMEKAFEARSADRRLAKSHLEAFRAEFGPIRDFLGNDVEVKLSETSQERLDNALARYLNVFMQAPKRSVATDAPQLYFPDCSQDVQRLMSELDAQELTQAEVREIKSAVGILLSYKVLTLQRSRATGFAPQVAPLLTTCNQYLEDARHLKGEDPSVFDLILWWRVAAARNDPRAQELQNTIRTFAEQALAGKGTLTSNDLGILAKDLYEQYRFADAQKLYSLILSQRPEGDQERALFIPSRYLGELGRALSVGSMAQQSVSLSRLSEAREQLSEAAWAFESARTTLNLLPEESPDLKLKLATVCLGLARIEMLHWKISQDGKHLDTMRRHHSDARALAKGPLLSANIAQDLHNVSQFQEATSEFSQAIGAAPYLANELKPKRACCHAQLGQQDEMLDDIESILTNAASNSSTEQPLPISLTTSAMAVGVYLSRWGEKLENEERGFLLETMKELLKQTEKRCAQGAPYTLPQLQLDSAYFAPLKESDPVFWAEFERSVSLTASFSTAAK
jgi:tetratricopeptide (TPR) repeat protein